MRRGGIVCCRRSIAMRSGRPTLGGSIDHDERCPYVPNGILPKEGQARPPFMARRRGALQVPADLEDVHLKKRGTQQDRQSCWVRGSSVRCPEAKAA